MTAPSPPEPSGSAASSAPAASAAATAPGAHLWAAQDSAKASGSAAGGWEREVLEKLVLAAVAEQRAARRWRIGLRLLFLGVMALIAWSAINAVNQTNTPMPARKMPHTAVVDVYGEISVSSEASAQRIVGALRRAFKNASARAVVLRINSPGGSPVQSGIIHDEILRLRQEYDKPVYAVVEEVCASGAYYIAAAADEIFVDKASIVGSIGVLMDGFGFTGSMEKLGVERRLLTAGDNKGFLDPFSPMSAKQRAFAQQMLDDIHQQFIDVVRNGRGARLHESAETFSGLFWNGEQAVEMGLADGLGSLGYVAREVVEEEEIVDYSPRDNWAERLAKELGVSLGQGVARTLRTTLAQPLLR